MPYEIREIPGKGKGLIATAFIPKGTSVWKYIDTNIHVIKSKEEFENFIKDLPREKIEDILIHGYGWDN